MSIEAAIAANVVGAGRTGAGVAWRADGAGADDVTLRATCPFCEVTGTVKVLSEPRGPDGAWRRVKCGALGCEAEFELRKDDARRTRKPKPKRSNGQADAFGIVKVTRFKTPDGAEHDTHAEAHAALRGVAFRAWAEKWIEENAYREGMAQCRILATAILDEWNVSARKVTK